MHKTFISYHHANEQELKDDIITRGSGENFVNKSVNDGDINTNLSEETIMRTIRNDFLEDSTVVVVLIGEETANRPFVNSEIQAALWGEEPTGLLGVVRDELYDRLYSSSTCTAPECGCGISLRTKSYEYREKVPYLVRENNIRLEDGKSTSPHYNNSDAYCAIYQYSYFINNIEKCIDESFDKREKNFDIKKRNGSGVKTIANPWGL